MEKEEILARSRWAREDDGEEFIKNRGREYGWFGMTIMFIVLALFNIWQGQNCSQILAISLCYSGLEFYGVYKIRGGIKPLLGAVLNIVASILFACLYIMDVLR